MSSMSIVDFVEYVALGVFIGEFFFDSYKILRNLIAKSLGDDISE